MTKSKFMRVAAVLMAAVLLTTCAISGTFAKYVTTGSGTSQTAQVAKWGVTILAATMDNSAFASHYVRTDTTYGSEGDDTVTAVGQYNILAPGTSDDGGATITISGTPEVASRVVITADVTLSNWSDGTDFYCPLVFTWGTEPNVTTIDGKSYNSASDLETALETQLSSTQDFAPNTPISAGTAGTFAWSWPFSTSAANDLKDKALGDAAAAGTAIPSITIAQSASVTQID